jgi:aminopeptidase N
VHALRLAVGDDAFYRILREWTASQAGQAVTTDDFVAVAERVSGQDLDALFQTWLFTVGKPGAAG